ncbi:DEAD/DEAH box helicase family protein [Micromonospora aurantiaca]|uniref:DEAD/DEAH box helicase family protein n=1 Tax=Micromonospora TaxID=1873 RepID=UPI002416DDD5|nr:DEAD/DEAH box helicase family protein [Micromonospora sp. WMMD718]MDG4754604.1 DEAD/DEAH box helicase family protein [Micromonospora sp. WMMD718]
MLSALSLSQAYRSGENNLLEEFYVPCLAASVSYDRAVGYFSSTLYQVAALAYSDFVRRGGRIRLVCSPALTKEDFEAARTGEDLYLMADKAVQTDLLDLLATASTVPATRLLATLIGAGVLQMRIAVPETSPGIFHDKLGIFSDDNGRRVTFVGSANETFSAWGLNHESFEVFGSWLGESDLLRTRNHSQYFEDLWTGRAAGVRTRPLSDVTQAELAKNAHDDIDHALAMARSLRPVSQGQGRPLMPHQTAVLRDWRQNRHRGIVAFATGAGKTLTAISAIREWTSDGRPALVLVPGVDLHKQWREEIRLELEDAVVLPAGAGYPPSTWQTHLPLFTQPESVTDRRRVVIATNATAASPEFRARLRQGTHLLLVVDELHRAGSPKVLEALESLEFGGTMGLSATYQRQYDADGTVRLLQVMGQVLDPSVGIADAMLMGRLVPYDYRLHTLMLEDDEVERYEHLTEKIRRFSAQQPSGDLGDSPELQMLLIQRARILKQAKGKVPLAADILAEEYRHGDRWLVYCDDKEQLHSLTSELLDRGLPCMEFYSGMDSSRSDVLQALRDDGGIVVAIRCLDEGVDIPAVDKALIVASSTVEREYVQRRGRVLRSSPGKVAATIHDLLLTDDSGGALTRSEAQRAMQFALLSRNRSATERLRLLVALSRDVDLSIDMSSDDGDESAE